MKCPFRMGIGKTLRVPNISKHGVSSRNVATFLVEQGYENVFSVIGGFDGWVKAGLPIETAY